MREGKGFRKERQGFHEAKQRLCEGSG